MRSRDGKCEDRLNNIHCNYDYGDCCLPVVDHVFCEDCICAEDGLVHRSRDCKCTANIYCLFVTEEIVYITERE